MQARFKAKISAMHTTDDGRALLDLTIPDGRVSLAHMGSEPALSPDARKAVLTARLSVMAVVAENLRYGETIYITLDTDEPVQTGN